MNVEQKARELLADELRRDGRLIAARNIESGITQCEHQAALRAIARALQQQGGSQWVRGLLREAVPYLRDAGEPFEDDGGNEPLELARRIEDALEWQRDGNYAIKSGEFVITKNSTSEGWIYLAFKGQELIAREKSAEAAKAACEAKR